MHLLDTNVVSELRKVHSGKADPGVAYWARAHDARTMFVSSITLMELELGVALLEARDARQAAPLRQWFERSILAAFAERTLPVDTAVARECARLRAASPRNVPDALIAATARVHGMVVVTRNLRDFEALGADVLNPWAG